MVRRYPGRVNEDERRAVEQAIAKTMEKVDGKERLKVIELTHFKNTHTLEGAAMKIPCSYETAKKWHGEFIWEVAKNFTCQGLL